MQVTVYRASPVPKGMGNLRNLIVLGIDDWNCCHERGIPSKHTSSAYIDYVPALCTHRPSLLPIE